MDLTRVANGINAEVDFMLGPYITTALCHQCRNLWSDPPKDDCPKCAGTGKIEIRGDGRGNMQRMKIENIHEYKHGKQLHNDLEKQIRDLRRQQAAIPQPKWVPDGPSYSARY